ncbi:MAG TPA: CvpA family protein [Bryobacteraceae bacterium]|nr:CvpA family protein [Bryobacteraceae bacterium]
MNWLDVLLLFILAISIATSFRKGLSREIIGLAAVVLALLLGIWFYGTAGSFLLPYVSSRGIANLAGFFIVFFGLMTLGSLVSYVIGRFLKVTGLRFIDHVLGAAFGAVRGLLVAVALITGIMAFSTDADHPPQAIVHSRLSPYVVDASRVIVAMAPYELKEGFHRSYVQVKEAWEQALQKGIRKGAPEKSEHERKI